MMAVNFVTIAILLGITFGAAICARSSNKHCAAVGRSIKVGQSRKDAERILRTAFRIDQRTPTETVCVCRVPRDGTCSIVPEYTLKLSLRSLNERVTAVEMWD